MDMQIVIPTHNRPFKQTTLNAIPEAIRDEVLLVVSTQRDYDILKPQHKNIKIAPVKTIADKRQWIMENVKAKKIFMLDDDMTFQARSPAKYREFNGRWKSTHPDHPVLVMKYATDKYVLDILNRLSGSLDFYAHAGISSRMGNDTEGSNWKQTTRMMHAIGYHRGTFLKEKLKFNEVMFREDFNITLHLLSRGHNNEVCYELCVSPGAYGAKGGASDERTVDLSNKAALKLKSIHPDYVRVVDKMYKNTPRKEVVIAWKKAYSNA